LYIAPIHTAITDHAEDADAMNFEYDNAEGMDIDDDYDPTDNGLEGDNAMGNGTEGKFGKYV
jgi:hypothetical protein